MRKKLVVLTGAGVSQESGIKTFRDSDGLWENYPVEEKENCLSGGTTFYPQKDRKLSASNNKRNNNRNYTRVYEYEEGESL